MHKWCDEYATTNGIKLHYYRTGGDKPQVVLNHGAMDDGLCWTRVTQELEKEYDVIMFDARGHGLSDSGQGDYRSTTRATDIIQAIETLGLNKPVVGGHSMGADSSMHVAAMRPDLIRGLFMEDPPITMPGEPIFGGAMGEKFENPTKTMSMIASFFKYLPSVLTKPLAKKMMPVAPDEEIIPWVNSKKWVNKDFIQFMKTPSDDIIEEPFSVLKNIKAPGLLFIGDRENGSIVSKTTAQEIKKILPNLTVTHLIGANHDIRRAQFDGYIKALKNFLADIYQ